MPTTIPSRLVFHAHHLAARLSVLTAMAVSVVLGGCVNDSFMATGPQRAVMGGAGNESDAIFDTPEAVEILSGVDAAALPEYGRRDAALGVSVSQPLLASAQWPQAERPNVDNLHSIYIPAHANVGSMEYPVFRPGYGYGYGYRYGGRWYWRPWRP